MFVAMPVIHAAIHAPSRRVVNWSNKGRRRNTTGTGRMKHLRLVHRRFKNGFAVKPAKAE